MTAIFSPWRVIRPCSGGSLGFTPQRLNDGLNVHELATITPRSLSHDPSRGSQHPQGTLPNAGKLEIRKGIRLDELDRLPPYR